MNDIKDFREYAEKRIRLEHRLRETYEDEQNESEVIELERRQLMQALSENLEKFNALHKKKEEQRRELRKAIADLESCYSRKEAKDGGL